MANLFQNNLVLIGTIFTSLITAGIALFWSKYPIRWLLVIATVGLGIFVFFLFKPGEIDPQLDWVFSVPTNFKFWIFALGVLTLFSSAHLVATLVQVYSGPPKEGPATDERFGDIQNAWREILIQLSREGIDPGSKDLYLLIAPDEGLAGSLLEAAGLRFFAKAPASAEAPIHCHAVKDALFLSCAGASRVGRRDAEGTARLEFLCRLIEALNPERPILRGIALLIPFAWSKEENNHPPLVAAIHEDLQVIRRTLKLRCPTLSVCCLPESIPGLNDFALRLPDASRQKLRCGFSVPISQATEDETIRRGMKWTTRWFRDWSLNLMVEKATETDSNGRLLSMNATLRDGRDRLIDLLDSALKVHQQDETVLYRGCYFAICGPTPQHHAFAAGLLEESGKGRMMTDRGLTTWSRESDLLDRSCRRRAYVLGIVSVAVAGGIWTVGILPKLSGFAGTAVGWSCLAVLGLIWVVGLLGLQFPAKGQKPR